MQDRWSRAIRVSVGDRPGCRGDYHIAREAAASGMPECARQHQKSATSSVGELLWVNTCVHKKVRRGPEVRAALQMSLQEGQSVVASAEDSSELFSSDPSVLSR